MSRVWCSWWSARICRRFGVRGCEPAWPAARLPWTRTHGWGRPPPWGSTVHEPPSRRAQLTHATSHVRSHACTLACARGRVSCLRLYAYSEWAELVVGFGSCCSEPKERASRLCRLDSIRGFLFGLSFLCRCRLCGIVRVGGDCCELDLVSEVSKLVVDCRCR